jgi:GNAT superfamily N-acetyltransferase
VFNKSSLSVSASDNDQGFRELGKNLIEYNNARFGAMNIQPLLITFREGSGPMRCGLAGKTFYNWLTIDLLWVKEELRGQGYGRALLERAEDEARMRGCTDAWLDTIGLEAPGFYEKCGYVLWGALSDYPKGHQRSFFRKPLRAAT